MPELPEVETIRRSLDPLVVGRRIEAVEIRCRQLRRPLDKDFAGQLVGRAICATGRRAKYLLFGLDNGKSWILHFGMSGRLFLRRSVPAAGAGTAGKHDHVIVSFDDGAALVFHDPRRFGLMLVDEGTTCPLFDGLGPEPFDCDAFDGEYLKRLGRTTRRSIKDVLMDQRVVAGLGNIYVNEALFACGLRPRRRLSRLTRAQCNALVESCRRVLREAVEHRGSSISDFLDGVGRRGGYQYKHHVYDRAGEPCSRCGSTIKSVVIGQRSSFYCPKCQS